MLWIEQNCTEEIDVGNEAKPHKCPICLEAFDNEDTTAVQLQLEDCKHVYCHECVVNVLVGNGEMGARKCPICRAEWIAGPPQSGIVVTTTVTVTVSDA